MKNYIIPFILLIILIIILYLINFYENKESFSNNNNNNYLYPVKGLSLICEKENLYPSFMPKACYLNGTLNSYANCKCEDENGNCKICYPTIKKDSYNSNIVYDSTKS